MRQLRFHVLLATLALGMNAAPGRAAAIVGVAPPAPIVEVVPAPPAVGYVWQPGHWSWNGIAYIWHPGAYVAAPHPGVAWIPGHWVPRGDNWFWVAGHWI